MFAENRSLPIPMPGYFARRSASAKTGLHLLMASITSMFLLFFISYILRSQVSDWQALSEPWQPLGQTNQLWLNSAFLLVASIALECVRRELRKPELGNSREFLWLAGFATSGFLIGQLTFWNYLTSRGYYATSNPANAFFYLLTGLHGLHLMGGMVAWLIANTRLQRERRDPSEKGLCLATLSVELCALYWHFLLLVWVLLFALLSSSPGTYAAIAEFCGFGG